MNGLNETNLTKLLARLRYLLWQGLDKAHQLISYKANAVNFL